MATRNHIARRGSDLMRFDPWTEFQEVRRTMDALFNQFTGIAPSRFMGGTTPMQWTAWEPNVELYETPDEVVFTAELPGFSQEHVNLNVTADTLQLSAIHREQTGSPDNEQPLESQNGSQADQPEARSNGEGSSPSTENGSSETGVTPKNTSLQASQPQHPRTYHIQGQQRRSISLSYTLPVEIKPEDARATFKNGVLEVHMPKSERNKPRQVQVQLNQ